MESRREHNLRSKAERRGMKLHRRTRINYMPFPYNARSLARDAKRYWLTVNGEKLGGANGYSLDEAEAIIEASTLERKS
jgi:hypothetical protein